MRLIDTKTLALKEFLDNEIPPYAILSHTWDKEEVSFQDWAHQSLASQKKGYKKISDTCELAKKHGYDYVWVDTNCIDKSSSAELTEAINSMFKWYKSAQVCYVYLFDVPSSEAELTWNFRNSRWFTRGWTLQELLAPRDVEFYSNDWSFLGTKESLCSELSVITGINIQYLWGKFMGDTYIGNSGGDFIARSIEYIVPIRKASVGERLSWLSKRTTTRLEDMAYCMLGIFELNMPLLYGEGSKAFTRLQEEIMKVSDDHSIFCWTWNTPQNRGGFLSEVPSEFKCADRFVPKQEDERPSPYTFTNAGLNIRLPILHGWKSSFIGILRVDSVETGKILGLPMSGNLKTARVYRKPFPPEPIPLCNRVSANQEFNLFVSENYSQKDGYGSSIKPMTSTKKVRTKYRKEFTMLLTFESQGMVRGIKTSPSGRFDPAQSSINIYSSDPELSRKASQFNWMFGKDPIIPFMDPEHTYEGVLVQLELQTGELKSFMIASIPDDGIVTQWKWHHWHVPPKDASTLLSKRLEGSSPAEERAHRAIKDPDYAQTLESQSRQSRMSILIAKDYLRIDNRAVCHMHLA